MQKGFSTIILLIGVLIIVGLGGAYYLGQQSTNKMVDLHQEWMPEANNTSPTPDPTANWKTYTDNTNRFEFEYPSNWFFQNNPDVTGEVSFFVNGATPDFGYGDHQGNEIFTIATQSDNRTLDTLKKNYYSTAEDIILGDKPAIKTSFGLIVVKLSNDLMLNIVTGLPGAKSYSDQILSTFKFTDQISTVDTSSWKTYSNQNLGVLLQYPSSWIVSENDKKDFVEITTDNKYLSPVISLKSRELVGSSVNTQH